MNLNSNFSVFSSSSGELILYKHRNPLFVINYEPSGEPPPSGYAEFFGKSTAEIPIGLYTAAAATPNTKAASEQLSSAEELERAIWQMFPPDRYKAIHPDAIKSIYINENIDLIRQYADRRLRLFEKDDLYSCVVFIETYDDWDIPVEGAKGVRKTWLEGYSTVREFYSPDYSALPPEPDYRRTLYWNPAVTADENGAAHIRFYNNSNCLNFSISAETVTSQGMIGRYTQE